MVEYIIRVERHPNSLYTASFEAPASDDTNGAESLTCSKFSPFLRGLRTECRHVVREGFEFSVVYGNGLSESEVSRIRRALDGNLSNQD